MSKKNPETIIQAKIEAFLRKSKVYTIRLNADGDTVGEPDLLCCYKGRFVGLEVKTKKGVASGIQKGKRLLILESGGAYAFPTSVDDVIKLFRQIDEGEI